jgi:putative transposase
MNKEEFIKRLYQSIIKENCAFYRDLFTNTDISDVSDPYWKEALKLYAELSDENKKVLFKIIEQVEVDSVSNILGVLDGVVSISEEDIEIKMTINGSNEMINGDLQDLFLKYVEENS